jgi:hypothetical protein
VVAFENRCADMVGDRVDLSPVNTRKKPVGQEAVNQELLLQNE